MHEICKNNMGKYAKNNATNMQNIMQQTCKYVKNKKMRYATNMQKNMQNMHVKKIRYEKYALPTLLMIHSTDIPPPWPSWQGESGVQSFDLDGVGSIPAIPPTQFTCFVDEFNKLA